MLLKHDNISVNRELKPSPQRNSTHLDFKTAQQMYRGLIRPYGQKRAFALYDYKNKHQNIRSFTKALY